jgi:fumarate hydratase class II
MMHPLIAHETLSSIDLLTRTCVSLAERCVDGIEADRERCTYWIEWSLALVTPLATVIGYDKASELAYKAYREKRTIRDVVSAEGVIDSEELDRLLDPSSML